MTRPTPAVPPVVLSAPSGAGKTTIARALVDHEDDCSFSISATTRALRGQEVDGEDYWFLSVEEFRAKVALGEFAEWAEVHGDLYGTPLASLSKAGEGGRHVLLDIDVQGAAQIKEAVPEALLLFILPPSVEVLLTRLLGRGTEGEEAIRRRLTTAMRELEAAEGFDFFIINRDLDQAISEVRELVRAGESETEGTTGSLEDVRELREGIEALLGRDHLSDSL
jgi:guanylate kinase